MRSSPGGKPRAKLARGWREHEDADGCPYYRHRKTGQVQWRPPIDCHLGAPGHCLPTHTDPCRQFAQSIGRLMCVSERERNADLWCV